MEVTLMPQDKEQGVFVELSKEEWAEMALGAIAGELGLTAKDFFERQHAGQLEPHPAVPDIMMLLKTRDNFEQELLDFEKAASGE